MQNNTRRAVKPQVVPRCHIETQTTLLSKNKGCLTLALAAARVVFFRNVKAAIGRSSRSVGI